MPIKILDVIVVAFSVFSLFFFLGQGKWFYAAIPAVVGVMAYNDLFRRSPRE